MSQCAEERVPILIVGGGGAGLTASMLLARQGVEHLLVSARPTTSDLPKAHVLNQRAMEVLDDVGVADAIAQRSTPAEQMAATAFYAGFAGPDPDYGRPLAQARVLGRRRRRRVLARRERVAAAEPPADPPRAADEGARGGALAGPHPLQPRADRAATRTTTACSPRSATTARATEYRVRSEYLIGADGGRRIAGLIGVEYEGLGVIAQEATLHVTADFSALANDPDVLIRWIYSPQAGVLVVMVPMGPERWGPDSEEWVIHLNYPAHTAQSDAQIEADVRAALGHRRAADGDPQDHALVDGGGARVLLPGRSRLPDRRRRAPAPADRRARAHERDPRRAEPLLEARRGPPRRRLPGAAGDLRRRAPAGGPAQLPALAGERAQPLRDR